MARVQLDELLAHTRQQLERQALQRQLQARQSGNRQGLLSELLLRQQRAELAQQTKPLHPADLAYLLERLPGPDRQRIWDAIAVERRGSVLIELEEQIRQEILTTLNTEELHACTQGLGADDLADVLERLPRGTVEQILAAHEADQRAHIETALSFPPHSAGALMDLEHVTVRDTVDVQHVLQELRLREVLPDHTNQLLAISESGALTGLLPLRALLTAPAEKPIADLLNREPISFFSDEPAEDIAAAFERYDLITAPVLNAHGHPIGRITVDAVMDFRSEESQRASLQQVGLSEAEDWHGPVWEASRRRWQWLGLNLMTAFVASRVIGMFEGTIDQFVALAALMPIVASIGGNTGNQTAALFIRGLTRKQVDPHNALPLIWRELRIGSINGLLWGLVAATFAVLVYGRVALGAVVIMAMLGTMLISALAGALVPLALDRAGRDPVMGSSVILTGITDCAGFLTFLGLATLLLF